MQVYITVARDLVCSCKQWLLTPGAPCFIHEQNNPTLYSRSILYHIRLESISNSQAKIVNNTEDSVLWHITIVKLEKIACIDYEWHILHIVDAQTILEKKITFHFNLIPTDNYMTKKCWSKSLIANKLPNYTQICLQILKFQKSFHWCTNNRNTQTESKNLQVLLTKI